MNLWPHLVMLAIFSVAANQLTIKQCIIFFLSKYWLSYDFSFAILCLLDLKLSNYNGKDIAFL